MLRFIASIFGGNKSNRDIRQMQPLLEKINVNYQAFNSLSHDQLRAKTSEFRQRIADFLASVELKRLNLMRNLLVWILRKIWKSRRGFYKV